MFRKKSLFAILMLLLFTLLSGLAGAEEIQPVGDVASEGKPHLDAVHAVLPALPRPSASAIA